MTRALRRALRSSSVESLTLGVLLAAVLVGVRGTGLLQFLELTAYDVFVRLRAGSLSEPAPVSLVAVGERDLVELGYPLSDDVLAEILERLTALGPRAIGVDLYRTHPVPPGSARLEAAVRRDPRIVLLEKFGKRPGEAIAAPAWAPRERIGFSDLPVDRGGLVRRALLYLWDEEGRSAVSFALQLAVLHLRPEHIAPAPDPDRLACVRFGAHALCPLERNDGGYVRADADGFQLLLDYREGWNAFPTASVGDVLSGRVDPTLVRGRTVILGTMAASVPHAFYTPLSEGLFAQTRPLFGGEVHAYVLSQLLRHARGRTPPLRMLSDAGESLLVLLLGLLGAVAGLVLHSLSRVGSLLALGLAGGLATAFLLFQAGWWVPVTAPSLAWVGAAVLAVAHLAWREHRENQLLVALLGPKVADTIALRGDTMVHQGRVRPRLATVTVLMSDLQGFTGTSEEMDPIALMDWLGDYRTAMAEAIESHHGVIDAFIGDGIKADFGVASEGGEELDRDARNAVRAALAMAEALEPLNREWERRDLPTGRMRIGIATGPAPLGSLGAGRHIGYTSIGDTVNTAARLESFDKDEFAHTGEGAATRILITGQTLSRLGGRFETEPLGEFELRGQKKKVAIHRVIRARSG